MLDTAGIMPPLHMSGVALPWVHQVNPALGALAPSDGSFVPGILEVVPGNPSSQQIVEMPLVSDSGGLVHVVRVASAVTIPVTSGPGRIALGLLLLLGSAAASRRRTRSG